VAGLIVAIGITADSFIVYFERVRDELREGRALASAVEAGWIRAVRTVVVSDAVNLLAAVVLFVLAVGNVRGFAFTLGVTTVVDLLVVILFTHPLLQLLARTKFFASGHPLSGLNPRALGAVYRGRAKFVVDETITGVARGKVSKEARTRQTIAERRAAENGGDS
jgi:preprotein translocase subunit SecD